MDAMKLRELAPYIRQMARQHEAFKRGAEIADLLAEMGESQADMQAKVKDFEVKKAQALADQEASVNALRDNLIAQKKLHEDKLQTMRNRETEMDRLYERKSADAQARLADVERKIAECEKRIAERQQVWDQGDAETKKRRDMELAEHQRKIDAAMTKRQQVENECANLLKKLQPV